MKYQSTRGNSTIVSASEAILKGLSENGGLYVPVSLDFSSFDYRALESLSYLEMAEKILAFFLDDYDDLKEIIRYSYENHFETADITPVKKVDDTFFLELFHGPTLAFKDVALQILPSLLTSAKSRLKEKRDICILTATSGDTGKAAMAGFSDVPGTRIIVFYPDGGVSPVQKLQMATQKGNNVLATAVKGNFDDTQTGVKNIFNGANAGTVDTKNVLLSSANSINLGRLVPQVVYYFKAYFDLVKAKEITCGEAVNFCVPTGNFGDILAGYYAKRMGCPINQLICASNQNNVLTDFIKTGVYDRNRPFHKTFSPSMDILISSNLERLLYFLSDGNTALVAKLMQELNETGRYEIPSDMLAKMKETFLCGFADDEKTLDAIRKEFQENHYIMDPHTAIAFQVLKEVEKTEKERIGGCKNIVLSTASCYKFPQAVAKALDLEGTDEFELMEKIEEKTGVSIPKPLAELRSLPVRFNDCIEKAEMQSYVERKIDE